MFTRTLTAALGLTLLATHAPAQEAMYVRPDGNGYYYHAGASPFRPGSPYRDIDNAILHDDLDRRDYQRSRILDTGLRYGNLTPAQRQALLNELQQSRNQDDAYHSGYHRGQSTYQPIQPWGAGYRSGYGSGYYGPGYYGGYGRNINVPYRRW